MNMSSSIWELDKLRRQMHGLAQRTNPNIISAERGAYYPGEIIHLNGNNADNSWGNLAITCPCCEGRIMLSRYTPRDIWLLKAKGLNYAEIGRLLDISRERARQLSRKFESTLTTIDELQIDKLVKEVQGKEKGLIEDKYRWAEARRISEQTRFMAVKDAYYELLEEGRPVTPPKPFKKRVTDKRTIRKRILAEMQRLGIKPKMVKGANHERTHSQEG